MHGLVLVANAFALACATLSLIGWIAWIWKRDRCVLWRWFPTPADRPAHVVGLLDLCVAFLILILTESAVASLFAGRAVNATVQIAHAVAHIFAVIVIVGWLIARHRATWAECGFDPRRFGAEIRLGLVFSILLIPVVLAIQIALIKWGGIDYQHDTLEAMTQQATVTFWLGTFLSAGIATPILEEYLYRFLMQGFFHRIVDALRQPETNPNTSAAASPTLLIGGRSESSWSAHRAASVHWFAVCFASLLFAAAHLGQGAAPIPLFFFAVGLGFLRWRTGSVMAPIIVHMVLNLYTLTMVVMQQLTSV